MRNPAAHKLLKRIGRRLATRPARTIEAMTAERTLAAFKPVIRTYRNSMGMISPERFPLLGGLEILTGTISIHSLTFLTFSRIFSRSYAKRVQATRFVLLLLQLPGSRRALAQEIHKDGG